MADKICLSGLKTLGYYAGKKLMDADDGKTVRNRPERGPGGLFAPGNKIAAGSRNTHRQKLQKALFDCVTESDIADVVAAMLTAAKGGDVGAAKLVFDRIFGKTVMEPVCPEDDLSLSEAEKRQQVVSRFNRLTPDAQELVRRQLRERKQPGRVT